MSVLLRDGSPLVTLQKKSVWKIGVCNVMYNQAGSFYDEFLVHREELIGAFYQMGYDVERSGAFNDMLGAAYDGVAEERAYRELTGMYAYYVFRKPP
jgi:hypothetical protein